MTEREQEIRKIAEEISRLVGEEDMSGEWKSILFLLPIITELRGKVEEHFNASMHNASTAVRKHGALKNLLKRYVDLVNCGDCGNWNPEEEDVVIAARKELEPTT